MVQEYIADIMRLKPPSAIIERVEALKDDPQPMQIAKLDDILKKLKGK